MRKHDVRKWLHAVLDLLPVILIPVFMIYSHRHDMSTDIQIEEPVVKDFYQGIVNGEPNGTLNGINTVTGTQLSIDDDYVYLEIANDGYVEIAFDCSLDVDDGDVVYYSFISYVDEISTNILSVYENASGGDQLAYSDFNTYIVPTFQSAWVNDFEYSLHINSMIFNCETGFGFYVKDFQIFNLTTIFGSGNEPTKEEFEGYLLLDYYPFGSSDVITGSQLVNVKNNDIMSVFMDSFNHSVDKYFNMGNVFNLNNVYQWFNVHIFSGNVPQVIYSIWNIALYELVMDLLFLLYGLFMWFIDMIQKLMEKPLNSVR